MGLGKEVDWKSHEGAIRSAYTYTFSFSFVVLVMFLSCDKVFCDQIEA